MSYPADVYNLTQWKLFAAANADKRTDGWPLMGDFRVVALISVGYILLVAFGPAVFSQILRPSAAAAAAAARRSASPESGNKRAKKSASPVPAAPKAIAAGTKLAVLPFLKEIMIFYNVCVILLNLALFIGFVRLVYTRNYNWVCNAVDYQDDLSLRLVYAYFLSKGVDFTDTVFMLLRGKFEQATFLHCYHHLSMFLIWWVGARYVGGGSSVVGPMINCFVHVCMYSYYLANALKVPVPLVIKKSVTKMQITQLFLVMLYSVVVAQAGCNFDSSLLYAQAVFLFTLLVLFVRFYVRAYYSKRQQQQQAQAVIAAD